jgi:pimeloyl-ACP methyl ester carboxylesterase
VPYAEVNGVRLYYVRAGSGEPEMFFVPGWCCDHTAFRPQFDYFQDSHVVTAVDLRGVGKSDRPEQGYSIPELTDDVALLCAEVGIEKPVIVGHSLGGMIAVELAARYPALPSALVLVDPGPIDPPPDEVDYYRAFAEQLEGADGEAIRREYVGNFGTRDGGSQTGSLTTCAGSSSRSLQRSSEGSPSGTAASRSRAAGFPSFSFARGSKQTRTCFGCSRSSRTWRLRSLTVLGISTSSRCPSR